MVEYVKIPKARIGVLIGENGEVRRQVEEDTQTKLKIEEDETVIVTKLKNARDPLAEWVARDVVKAIGRGFNPTIALRLAEEENCILDVIELSDYIGKSEKTMDRIRGRVIGEEGRAKKCIEDLTKSDISIYGKTVSIIGSMDAVPVAHEAIVRLVEGQMHATVFRFLERKRRELKIA